MKRRGAREGKRKPQGLKPTSPSGSAARLKSCPDTRPQSVRSGSAATHLVQIEKPIYGGAFLARVEGKAVFVPLTLPGERVCARIVGEKRSYATAEVEENLTTAPERVAPACPHFGACGGCQYQHAQYAAQIEFKKTILRETLERGGVHAPEEIAVLAAEPWAYRNRIRMAFDVEGKPGYRGRRSHEVIPIAECPIAAPLLVRAALAAGEIVRERGLELRPSEIALFCNADESTLLATVVTAHAAKGGFEDFAGALVGRILELRGAELVVEGRGGLPPRGIAQWGASSLPYIVNGRAGGFAYRVDHGAFFQVNRWLVDALVERVTREDKGRLAWDLFAGVGLFTRALAGSFARVAAVEAAPAAMDAVTQNLGGTNAYAVKTTTLEFLLGARRQERPDLIVVDPPRAGLGVETTALLGEIAAPALVYVSCDPATLARDLRELAGAGYVIEDITLADLFPQTFHLESVVRLRR